ncbi:hypothetical protein AK812_SmicGene19427 [Symbiodinium microadriaticum]|uniref:Uncharacterized protein n=1 Tax=Symbiodinium microadriaticum TaxID=2951 RepID=A0A1Q9DSJ5_SYMMI|nr:hypothetical protein AK812_SmicGene19427 [Symbiodinium microadriaticum]
MLTGWVCLRPWDIRFGSEADVLAYGDAILRLARLTCTICPLTVILLCGLFASKAMHLLIRRQCAVGELRSAAILRYVDPDVLDLPACLDSLSDAEGEEPEE